MKTIKIRELQKHLRSTVDASQSDAVVVTRRGQPAAVIVGVEGKDWESVLLETSPEFWSMITERRRKGRSSPIEAVRKRLMKD